MGIVFLARDSALDRYVAIKLLRPEIATADAKEGFIAEAQLLAKLVHPNVVPVHDVGESGGFAYYVMDYVQGETLQQRLARKPMSNNEAMMQLFRENAVTLVGESEVVTHRPGRNRGGSTDMGDLSQIMPVIHPYTGAATGAGHSSDYVVEDYEQAVVNSAKAMAMTVIDLLFGDGDKAKEVLDQSPPAMTKAQYLALQNSHLSEELYEGR